MGKRGTKPLPDTIKLDRGTYRSDRSGDPDSKPKPNSPLDLSPPESLGEAGREAWTKTLGRLVELGVATELDSTAFATYCRTFDEVADCDQELEKDGCYYVTDKGYVGQHPAVNQRFKWLEIRRKYETEFGMTPSSRTGVIVNRPKGSGVARRKRA